MSTRVFISVISHNQETLIKRYYQNFPKQVDDFMIHLSILDNTGSKALEEFCQEEGIFYYYDGIQRGFGHNHNLMFKELGVKDEDIFIISNPDLSISAGQLPGILESFVNSEADLFSVTSYLDKEKQKLDFPDRYFPGILNFPISVLTGKRLHYGSRNKVVDPEWMSGAFMIWNPASFRVLGGFDEGYFMYCEDIDICLRAKEAGMKIVMDPDCYIEHHSQMASRKLFSKNLLWHIRSTFRYIVKNRVFKPLVIAKT